LKFLADLDLAMTCTKQLVSAPGIAGTKIFMAIGALLGEPHNFMHDLESFFWVLFWVCIHWNGPGKKRGDSDFEDWNYLSTEKLAREKRGLVVEEESFKKTTAGFTFTCHSLAPCVRDLRRYIFPNGKRWLGENKELYSQMKAVLEKAREDSELQATGPC